MQKHIIKTIRLKKGTGIKTFTSFCNKAEKDGVFQACGSPDDMWIMVRFDDEISMAAWFTSLAC